MAWVLCWLATPVVGGDYNAVDKNGVRVFSKVPPVGVHPRVILSPEDLPGWRESVRETYRGREFLAKRYEDGYITALAALDDKLSGKELAAAAPQTNCGNNHKMLFATIDVIYHQDEARARTVCKAVANFARVLLARSAHKIDWGKWAENIGGIQGLNGIRTGLNELWQRGGADFALAYDFLYDYMTEEQRDTCRRALSVTTKDLVCWGMDFPRGRGISNWYGYHGELGPMLLAIEGEEGYRPERWEMFKRIIRNWAEVHFHETGGSNEDGYSINTSLREGQFTLIAMARRGENHYQRPNIPNYFKWIVLSLVPGEDTGETVGYDWYMPIADDLELKARTGGDAILGEKGEKTEGGKPAPGSRRLLVRFLSPANVDISINTHELCRDKQKGPIMGTRLTGAITCVEPDYKVMLVPFLVGEPLPESRGSTGTV